MIMNPKAPVVQATPIMGSVVVLPAAVPPPPRLGPSTVRSSSLFQLPESEPFVVQEAEIRTLQEQGFTEGLVTTMTKNNAVFPLRIWVVDNSGSMNRHDGHRIIETSRKEEVSLVDCTRWAEMQQTVQYHAQLAALVRAPTVFRLLNDPGRLNGHQQFSVGEDIKTLKQDLAVAVQTMDITSPGGCTPLTDHVREIRANVMEMEQTLRRDGTRVTIILATDGLPTNEAGVSNYLTQQEFVEALRSLEGLPVWIVVRLCTDEKDVVKFYNDLDAQLERSLEVLDDFVDEGREIYKHNKWLNYALPLHRMREMGYHNRLFDLLDERLLTRDELRDFMRILFGDSCFDGVPDPQTDWSGFEESVEAMLRMERKQWNPIKKKMLPWIDMKKLKRSYKSSACSIM